MIKRVLVVCGLVLAGCRGSTSDSGAGHYYLCEVNEAQLLNGGDCLWDDACPCGSHCNAGSCVFSCRHDADCGGAGQVCDGFGRCILPPPGTPDASVTVATPVDTSRRATLKLGGVPVTLDEGHTVGELTLVAQGVELPEAKLVVGQQGGIELKCAPDAAFATSCVLKALKVGEVHTITVRVNDLTHDDSYEAGLLTDTEALGFRVRYTKRSAVALAPLEGVYRGYAHPVAFGSVARSVTSPLPTPLAELTLPLELTVYPEVGNLRPVVLRDPLGLLFPDDVGVGAVAPAGNGVLQRRHVARPFVGSGLDGGAADVDISAASESVAVERGLTGLSITLRTRFAGVLDAANDPYVTWQLSLGRVADVGDGGVAPSPPSAYAVRDPSTRAAVPTAAERFVTGDSTTSGTLKAPLAALKAASATPADLAQATICTPVTAATATKLKPVIGSPTSGDFDCASPSATSAPPLTFTVLKETTWQLADQLTKCLGDLKVTEQVLTGTLTMTPPAVAPCIDGPRVMAALAAAQQIDRSRALGATLSADPLASALAHRLLQQWLRTNAFVAKQATQVDVLNDILAGEVQLSTPLNQFDMLAVTGRGYDLVLQPRVAMGLNRLLPQVLLSPDYRPLIDPTAPLPLNPRHEQTTALPVALVDTLHQTLGVYDALYERARYVPTDRVPLERSAREFLRKSVVLFALASNLSDTAQANSPTAPRWLTQWNRQAGLYGIGFAGLVRSIDNLRKGENPLGIDDKLDLPLYRVGDQTGTIAQFSAVSDYLLGTGSTLDNSAIVPAKILAAEAALTDARAAYTQNLQQAFTQTGMDADAMRRLDAINRRYGEQISSLCGDPTMNSATVLDTADAIDPDTCFIKPACLSSRSAQRSRMAPGDLARVLCTAASVREQLGSGAAPGLLSAFVPAQLQPLLDGRVTVRGATENGGTAVVTMSDGTTVTVATALFTSNSATPPAGALSPQALQALQSRCDAVAAASENVRPDAAPDTCTLNGDCPGSFACVAGRCQPAVDSANQTACYQGSLGEMAVSIRGAVKDVEIARSELAELSATYDLQMRKCITAHLGAQAAIDATTKHNQTMTVLGGVKLAADVASNAATGVAACADAVGGDTKLGIASAVSCGADAVVAAADSVSDGMQFAMDQADRAHDLELQQIEAQTEERTCFIEAEMALVGTRTATLRIQRAMQEVAGQLVALENAKNDLRGNIQEGHQAVAAEKDLTVPAISIEYWLNEKVELYGSAFRAARRVTYLGVLAVEYEYQLSTVERGNVLAATKVSELRGVLERLRALASTGTVRGRNPSTLHSVVSLRNNLLQLSNQTTLPAGWHSLTDVQRFQLLLTSPRFAVYGPDGAYLGQELPFRVAPLAAFKLGQTGGVALLSGQDCGERVWSVNAALAGDGIVVGDATRARITLKKRNRFFSQWCAPPPSSDAFQVNAVRPSRNLFLDPFQDYLPGAAGGAQNPAATIDAAAEADAFTAARLQPVLNVSRADFETDQFFNGSSRELAGRGLYGDYSLFFPVEVLATGTADGLRLDHLSDVLLRFDFVSVAQN